VPDEGQERSIAEDVLARRRKRPWPLVGLGLVEDGALDPTKLHGTPGAWDEGADDETEEDWEAEEEDD
jgi:hypothetical protein